MFSSQVLCLWKLKICRGMFLTLETEEGIALAMTELSHPFMRIISFLSKLNAKSRDVTLNRHFSVKSLNYLTNKDFHRSQSMKPFIRQKFYWLQGFQKQVASSLISTMPFWKDSESWFWNSLRRVQTDHSRITISFHSHCSIHSAASVQEKATK